MTQLNIKIPHYIRKEYYINSDFAKRCRAAVRTTLERLYDLEIDEGDTTIVTLKKKAEDLKQSVAIQRRTFESSQEELLAVEAAIGEREEQLRVEKEVKHTQAEKDLTIVKLLSDRRAVEYARRVREKNLHVVSPNAVLKAIKKQFGQSLDEDLLFRFLAEATGESI